VARSELSLQAAGGARWELRHDSAPTELYDHLLHVCLLLLLRETPAVRGDLRERLRPLGFELAAGAVDGALQELASQDLVAASDTPSGAADARAVYALTQQGDRVLTAATTDLRRTKDVLGGFLARCSERLVTRP